MRKRHDLYMIAIIPPALICHEIIAFKEEAKELFNTKQALKAPPHITLHMPFRLSPDRLERANELIKSSTAEWKTMNLSLSGFSGYPPKVIYTKVLNNETLSLQRKSLVHSLRESLHLTNADYKGFPFDPHITIAFRDLKKSYYQQCLDYFEHKAYEKEFEANEIHLLKRGPLAWHQFKSFKIPKSS